MESTVGLGRSFGSIVFGNVNENSSLLHVFAKEACVRLLGSTCCDCAPSCPDLQSRILKRCCRVIFSPRVPFAVCLLARVGLSPPIKTIA